MSRKSRRHAFAPRADRLEARELLAASAAYLGLANLDVAGPTAAIGPGGTRNLHVQLTIPLDAQGSAPVIKSLNVAGPTDFQWSYGTTGSGVANPQANPVVAIAPEPIASGAMSQVFDAYFSPVVSSVNPGNGIPSSRTLANGQSLTVTVAYAYNGGPIVTESGAKTGPSGPGNAALVVTPSDLNQALADPTPPLPNVTVGAYAGSFQGQTADGNAHIQLRGLPAGINPGTAELSDVAGIYWSVGSTYGRYELGMAINQASGSPTADIAFPPERDEAGSTLTLRYQLGTSQWFVTDVTLGAAQHTDPNLRDGGPINPKITPFVVSPASTNQVAYTDSAGHPQTMDFQQLLNSGHPLITLAEGTYNLSEILTIGSPLILQGVDSKVTLNFTGLSSVPSGVINLQNSHITLNQFNIRFQDASVNFTGENRAIISTAKDQTHARVDLNIENLNIQAPTETMPVFNPDLGQNYTVPTIYTDPHDAGTIQNNVIYGGTIKVQGGPWLISGNQIPGAVQGTLSPGAIAVNSGHDLTIAGNIVTDADPANHGLIDRFFVANNSGYGFNFTNNHVSSNVGLIAPVANGTPSTPQNPRNEPEEILFEDFAKFFEGSVDAIGVSSSSASNDNRRVISIPNGELNLFSGVDPNKSMVLTMLDGPTPGQHIRVIQVFPSSTDPNNTDFLLAAPLPTGHYDLDIEPAFIKLDISGGNVIDTSGTVSVGLVLASTTVDATVAGNTFIGDRSSLVDGNGNVLQSQAIRIDPNKANLQSSYLHSSAGSADYGSYNFIQVTISGNRFINAIGGIQAYVEVDGSVSTTTGRTYAVVALTNNQFEYSYANPAIIRLGQSGHFSRAINDLGVVPSPAATAFTDPKTIRLSAAGNTVQWTGGITPPASDTVVNAADVNGTLEEAEVHLSLLRNLSATLTVQVPLGSVFNEIGITADTSAGAASGTGFDLSGNSLSTTALGALSNTFSWQGHPFSLGVLGANNVVALGGTAIPLPAGKYTTLLVLGASTYGDKQETFTIFYTDGTSSNFVQQMSDWFGNKNGAGRTYPGESIAATMSYVNSATNGKQTGTHYLYGYTIPLDSGKTVAALGVINNNQIKIVAMDLIQQAVAVPLGSVYNKAGISTDGNSQVANFDTAGNSYSATALGGTVAWNGQTFNLGAAGTNNVLALGGVGIPVNPDHYSNFEFLGSSIGGPHAVTFTFYYADNTSSTYTQTVSDWLGGYTGPGTTAFGESIAAHPSYFNTYLKGISGRSNTTNYLYGYDIPVDPTRTLIGIGESNDNQVNLLAADLVYHPRSRTNLATGGTATDSQGSNAPSGQGPTVAFDGSAASNWLVKGTSGYLQYQFANNAAVVVTQYVMIAGADTGTYPGRAPKNWTFLASNDGVNWTTLDTQTSQADTTSGDVRTFSIANTTAYRFYRLNITANNGDRQYTQLAELQLLG